MGSSVALAAEARKRCSVKGLITFHTYYTCKRGGHTALLSGDVRICVYIYMYISTYHIYLLYSLEVQPTKHSVGVQRTQNSLSYYH